jgi:hypothetical protein
MKVNSIQNPAYIPSYFGAPSCGHASDVTVAGFGTTAVVRERAFAFTGDMGLGAGVQGSVKGTNAWSPPSS